MKKHRRFLVTVMIALTPPLVSCSGTDDEPADAQSATDSAPDSLTDAWQASDSPGPADAGKDVVSGPIRLFIVDSKDSISASMGVRSSSAESSTVNVNGKSYKIAKDGKGERYVDVERTANNDYVAAMESPKSAKWRGSSPFADIKVPHSQFYPPQASFHDATLSLADYPRFASYRPDNGNKLVFTDGFAALKLVVKGSASISSVHVEDPKKGLLAGLGDYSSKGMSMKHGVNFAVLNGTNQGKFAKLTSTGLAFYVLVAPREYSSGLKVRLTDSTRKVMQVDIPALSLRAGETKSVTVDYVPRKSTLWFEGFDNFVWGGNIVGGRGTAGFAPDNERLGIDDGAKRTGYEDAFTKVGFDYPGSGFIQSNRWDHVTGKTVATSHQMSKSYVKSRNIQDFTYLFRCQEYQGSLAVGAGSPGRGVLQTAALAPLPGPTTIQVSFDAAFQANKQDALLVQFINGGVISSCTIDGKPYPLTPSNSFYREVTSSLPIPASAVTVASQDSEPKTWHKVQVTVDMASDSTLLDLRADTADPGVHGFYLDNLNVTHVKDMRRSAKSMRVLVWNIQNGMWADQGHRYTNFVKFVKKYDPDVCVWVEGASIYATNSSIALPDKDKYLPDNWAKLAAKYGHKYTAIGGRISNYPQVVTSKFPITTHKKITGTDSLRITRGAGIHEVKIHDKSVYFLTVHLWPHAYKWGISQSQQAESRAKNEGDEYRRREVEYLLQQSIKNAAFSSVKNWIITGDFNSISKLDNWYYKIADNSTKWLAQKEMAKTTMVDVIAKQYPGKFMSSTGGRSRIDYIFASPALYEGIENAMTILDGWTLIRKHPETSFYTPSDHRPLLVDFKLD